MTLENSTVEGIESKVYKIVHFPQLDLVLNLDSPQEDRDKILQLLNQFGANFSIEDLLQKISFDKSGDQYFFIKKKPSAVKVGTKELISLIKNPKPEEVTKDFENKRARYGLAGVLNEILLSRTVKKIITSTEAQEMVKKYGFSAIKFSEPISALIDRKIMNKYLIYKQLTPAQASSENYDLEDLTENLREMFLKNGIYSHDLKSNQFILTAGEKGELSIVLIDIEAFTT